MNNYFGIGLDAKITLEFHQKREEHPEKCRSRTKNMMWFGVLGGKEIVARTYRNLDQRVALECDGRRIPLPNLQGIVVLNIPRLVGWPVSRIDFYCVMHVLGVLHCYIYAVSQRNDTVLLPVTLPYAKVWRDI